MPVPEEASSRVPTRLPLKQAKCPDCKESLAQPSLVTQESVVRVACAADGCGYTVDLMWVGGARANQN